MLGYGLHGLLICSIFLEGSFKPEKPPYLGDVRSATFLGTAGRMADLLIFLIISEHIPHFF